MLDRSKRGLAASMVQLACAVGSWFLVGSVQASDITRTLASGTPHDMLYAVSLDANHGIAVGEAGLIMASPDGGKTWARQAQRPTELALLTVTQRNGHCLVGGQSGLILTSPDCVNWTPAESGTEERILSVDMNRNQLAYAVGGFGTLMRSTDAGRTWSRIDIPWDQILDGPAEPHLYAVKVFDSGEVLVAGEFELVLRLDPAGHWTLLRKGHRSLFSVAADRNGVIFAVGQEGLILKSEDQGATWRELDGGTSAILTAVWADGQRHVVASGVNTIVSSNDGGATWHALSSQFVRRNWHLALAVEAYVDGKPEIVSVGSHGRVIEFQP